MTIKDDNQAMQPLYDVLSKDKYKLTATWTTSKKFVESYSDKQIKQFSLSQLPQVGRTARTRTGN